VTSLTPHKGICETRQESCNSSTSIAWAFPIGQPRQDSDHVISHHTTTQQSAFVCFSHGRPWLNHNSVQQSAITDTGFIAHISCDAYQVGGPSLQIVLLPSTHMCMQPSLKLEWWLHTAYQVIPLTTEVNFLNQQARCWNNSHYTITKDSQCLSKNNQAGVRSVNCTL